MVVATETNLDQAFDLAERIRSTVEQTVFLIDGMVVKVRASIGVVVAEAGKEINQKKMLSLAVDALRKAKGEK